MPAKFTLAGLGVTSRIRQQPRLEGGDLVGGHLGKLFIRNRRVDHLHWPAITAIEQLFRSHELVALHPVAANLHQRTDGQVSVATRLAAEIADVLPSAAARISARALGETAFASWIRHRNNRTCPEVQTVLSRSSFYYISAPSQNASPLSIDKLPFFNRLPLSGSAKLFDKADGAEWVG